MPTSGTTQDKGDICWSRKLVHFSILTNYFSLLVVETCILDTWIQHTLSCYKLTFDLHLRNHICGSGSCHFLLRWCHGSILSSLLLAAGSFDLLSICGKRRTYENPSADLNSSSPEVTNEPRDQANDRLSPLCFAFGEFEGSICNVTKSFFASEMIALLWICISEINFWAKMIL